MSLVRSYAIWNNKGGVGKSTITFHMAGRLGETREDLNILVIDACPQANGSMLLLGGGSLGENNVLDKCTLATPQTIVGYLSQVIASGPGAPLPNPMDYLIRVSDFNPNITKNVYLLCGDGNLEPMSPAISEAALARALTRGSDPWKWVHLVLRSLIEDICSREPEKDWLVLLDTNPSFSIYTELAIAAADRIIVPVNADDSSRVATNAVFILLHGQIPPHPVYGSWTFAARANASGIDVPLIHVIVGNRLTQYQGAATAFQAMSDATADTLFTAYSSHAPYFTPRSSTCGNVKDFRSSYSVALRDFNTAGVVAAHQGLRLSQMKGGYYPVYGKDVQVNHDRVAECINALDTLLTMIN